MSISPTPKNRSRSRSSSRHSPSDSSRSLSPLSLRSASPNTRSPGWSSKQSKKSNILIESKKIFIIMTVPQIKFHPHEAHHTHPSSSKSTSLKLGSSFSRLFECSSKEVKEPKTSSKCNYIKMHRTRTS